MKIAELRAKSKEELKEIVLNSRKEQFNLRMQASTGQLENRSQFTVMRKTIARAMTLLNEKPGAVKPAAKAEKPAAKKKTAKAKKEE